MSLSAWLKDYLYIPLGGSRKGTFRTYFNLLLTMTVCGLWHGATWNYVLWGFYTGVALALHRVWDRALTGRPRPDRVRNCVPYRVFAVLCTFFLFAVGLIVLRSEHWANCWILERTWLGADQRDGPVELAAGVGAAAGGAGGGGASAERVARQGLPAAGVATAGAGRLLCRGRGAAGGLRSRPDQGVHLLPVLRRDAGMAAESRWRRLLRGTMRYRVVLYVLAALLVLDVVVRANVRRWQTYDPQFYRDRVAACREGAVGHGHRRRFAHDGRH